MTLLPTDVDLAVSPAHSYEGFERRLILAIGATVGGDALSKALGYPSQDAFRKAYQRGRLPVATFELDGRRGRFAAAADIAHWLWCQRAAPVEHCLNPVKEGGCALSP